MQQKTIKYVRNDGTEVMRKVNDFDRIGPQSKSRLDAIDSNLSVFFQRQLEYIESELRFVEYGELKSWKHIPVESKGGDNKWYTWRLFDKVGKWKWAADDTEDVPEVNILGAELPTPIRMFVGGYKYNVQELLAGKQAAQNYPNAPSIQIEMQKAQAVFEAYQQFVDMMTWFADPTSASDAGIGGVFYNPYISTVSALVGVDPVNPSGKTTWYNSSGVLQKTPLEIVTDLNQMLTKIRVDTLDRYSADTILMPIEHFNTLVNTPISPTIPTLNVLKWFLQQHPEITTVDTLVPAKNVPAGGSISTASDVILAYKKDPSVMKLELPRQFTSLPIQERGYNYIVPCWATAAGIITYKPKAICMLLGTSVNAVGS